MILDTNILPLVIRKDGTVAFTGNQSFGDNDITDVGDIALDTISADDGSSFTISDDWTNAGNTIADLGTVSTVDINGGTVDGITSLTVANSVDIGNFVLTANGFTLDGDLTFSGTGQNINYGAGGVFADLNFVGDSIVTSRVNFKKGANSFVVAVTSSQSNFSSANKLEFTTSDTMLFAAVGAEKNITLRSPDILLEGEVEAGGTTTKIKLTSIGGYAIKLTNTTGVVTIKGQTVKADPTTNDAVILTAADDIECIGVFLDAGVADDAEAWVVVAGIADVAMGDDEAATAGNWVETNSTEIGYADATGASPAAAPQHFNEIGHCIETVVATGGGTHILARCVLHFN